MKAEGKVEQRPSEDAFEAQAKVWGLDVTLNPRRDIEPGKDYLYVKTNEEWVAWQVAWRAAGAEGWISVEEGLPQMDGITYLVYRIDKFSVKFIDTFTAQNQAAWYNRNRRLPAGITHWRPLPAAPVSGKENNEAKG